MNKSDFFYDLPEELIAQHPLEPRDHSRMMVLSKDSDNIEHKHFYDVYDYLKEGDCLILGQRLIILKECCATHIQVALHIRQMACGILLGSTHIDQHNILLLDIFRKGLNIERTIMHTRRLHRRTRSHTHNGKQ